MASKKKKIQVTIELNSREELNPYLSPTYPKIVVIDGYHPFWGRCEVAEVMLKKFQEEPANANKVDWISIPYECITDIIPKERTIKDKLCILVQNRSTIFSLRENFFLLLMELIIRN